MFFSIITLYEFLGYSKSAQRYCFFFTYANLFEIYFLFYCFSAFLTSNCVGLVTAHDVEHAIRI